MHSTPLTAETVFTFPSGATVVLPVGFIACASPDAVTYDASRLVPVGTTPMGRVVLSSYSCAAYCYAAHVFSLRRDVAEMRAHSGRLAARGAQWRADNVAHEADLREAMVARIVEDYADDPAPCTCPPVTV